MSSAVVAGYIQSLLDGLTTQSPALTGNIRLAMWPVSSAPNDAYLSDPTNQTIGDYQTDFSYTIPADHCSGNLTSVTVGVVGPYIFDAADTSIAAPTGSGAHDLLIFASVASSGAPNANDVVLAYLDLSQIEDTFEEITPTGAQVNISFAAGGIFRPVSSTGTNGWMAGYIEDCMSNGHTSATKLLTADVQILLWPTTSVPTVTDETIRNPEDIAVYAPPASHDSPGLTLQFGQVTVGGFFVENGAATIVITGAAAGVTYDYLLFHNVADGAGDVNVSADFVLAYYNLATLEVTTTGEDVTVTLNLQRLGKIGGLV